MMHDPGLLVKLSQGREELVGGSHPRKKENKKSQRWLTLKHGLPFGFGIKIKKAKDGSR
jgi:hypothetical protein